MRTPIKGFMVGAGLALAAFLVIAAVPAMTDFATTQFGTAGNKVSVKSGAVLTNAHDTGTFTADAATITNNAGVLGNLGVGVAAAGSQNLAVYGDGSGNGIGVGTGTTGGPGMLQIWQDGADSYLSFGDQLGSTLNFALGSATSPGGATKWMRLRDNGQLTLLKDPVAFGVLRADAGGTNISASTNISDLQATNLTVVNNTTLQNLTVNNTFSVNGKNGLAGTLTAGFLPIAGTATVFSNSIVKQNGLTDITVHGSAQVTNAFAVQSLVVSNTASGITPTAAAHFATKDYTDTLVAQGSWPLAADWIFAGTYPRSDSATLITVGDMSPTSTATIAAVANTESRAGHLTATTSTVLGNVSGWESGVTSWVPGARRTIFDCTVMLTDSVSNRVWIGLSAANMATLQGLDTPTSATAAFRFSFDAGDTQLMTVTMQDSATTPDVTTTGLTIVTNTLLRLRIDATPTSAGVGTVRYYTNGVLAYTSSVIPTNTILHRIQWGVSTRVTGASRQLKWFGTSIKSAYP